MRTLLSYCALPATTWSEVRLVRAAAVEHRDYGRRENGAHLLDD